MDRIGLICLVSFIVVYIITISICLIMCVSNDIYDDSDYDYGGNDRV